MHQVFDGVCALKSRVYSVSDEDTAALIHRYDFEWLLEAVVKVHDCSHVDNAVVSVATSVTVRYSVACNM